uniref:Uncharacterized protein n=1 Tax=Esox lucius TaxID=8010 RepID=A0A3P8YS05_ESOLU
ATDMHCTSDCFPHLYGALAAFRQGDTVTVHLHHAAVLVLGLHAEEGQAGHLPAGSGQQIGAGALEVVEKAIEGVVVRVAKDHTGAGARGLAVKGTLLLLTRFQLAARRLLAEHFIVYVHAPASAPVDLSIVEHGKA